MTVREIMKNILRTKNISTFKVFTGSASSDGQNGAEFCESKNIDLRSENITDKKQFTGVEFYVPGFLCMR